MNRTEGIILQAIKFQEQDQILSVFSMDQGIIKFITKKSTLSPLTQAEFSYSQGRSELHKCHEVSFINQHLSLRKDLAQLATACEMLKSIQHSQLPLKPAEPLYRLLTSYLEKLPSVTPDILQTSFYLKLLRYEGLIPLYPTLKCHHCHKEIRDYGFANGEFFCSAHSPMDAIVFDEEESNMVLLLAFSRSFADLSLLHLNKEFCDKLKKIFYSSI